MLKCTLGTLFQTGLRARVLCRLGWEGALEVGLPGSLRQGLTRAACMPGWSKGRPRR